MVMFTRSGKVIAAFRVKLSDTNHQQYIAKFDVSTRKGNMYYKYNVGFNQILKFPAQLTSDFPDGMFVGLGYAYGSHPVSGLNGYVVPHVVIHEAT
mmetsp:Transcript_2704/g.4250  ORF Transcript_2704/g.4250 Transcript_2704/m.4250 type:complete len:96 (+) Transcript_2704:797-1084(+)